MTVLIILFVFVNCVLLLLFALDLNRTIKAAVQRELDDEPPQSIWPTYRAMLEFRALFYAAQRSETLANVSMDRELARVRASLRPVLSRIRSVAGLLILTGLCITLFNLQGAVRSLGGTFGNLAQQQNESSAPGTSDGMLLRQQADIETSMGAIANAAGNAFRYSLGMIAVAVLLLFDSLVLDFVQAHALAGFEWSIRLQYNQQLPLQTNAAQRMHEQLNQTVGQLSQLATQFNSINEGLSALSGFRDVMSRATGSIETAIQKLPASIRASFQDFTADRHEDMLQESRKQTENMAALLAIYGQQQVGLQEVHAAVKAVREGVAEIAGAVKPLEPFPDAINTLTSVLSQHHDVTGLLTTAAKQLQDKVDGLPVTEMRKSLQDMAEATMYLHNSSGDIKAVRTELAGAVETLQSFAENTSTSVQQLPEELRKIAEPLNEVASNVTGEARTMIQQLTDEFGKLTEPLNQTVAALEQAGQKLDSHGVQVTRLVENQQRDLKQIKEKQDTLNDRLGAIKAALADAVQHSKEAAKAVPLIEALPQQIVDPIVERMEKAATNAATETSEQMAAPDDTTGIAVAAAPAPGPATRAEAVAGES